MKLFPSFLIIFLTLEPDVFADRGNGSSRVYGGYPLRITDAPWMAHINYHFMKDGESWVSGCGGSIANDMHILTAAHCTYKEVGNRLQLNTASQYDIRVGSANRNEGGYIYKVAKVIPHPSYQSAVKGNDVALLRLTKKITYTQGTVQNVRLDNKEHRAGEKVSSMGWGQNPKNPGTPQLYIVDLNIIDIAKCARSKGGSESEFKQHKVCAIGPKKADVCKGDSGGPLMYGHNNQQIGIVSYGADCPQEGQGEASAGVYTKILDNLAWINGVISGSKDDEDDDEYDDDKESEEEECSS